MASETPPQVSLVCLGDHAPSTPFFMSDRIVLANFRAAPEVVSALCRSISTRAAQGLVALRETSAPAPFDAEIPRNVRALHGALPDIAS